MVGGQSLKHTTFQLNFVAGLLRDSLKSLKLKRKSRIRLWQKLNRHLDAKDNFKAAQF